MEETLETVLDILRSSQYPVHCIDLVRRITEKTEIDYASAKALILRLSFEGKLKIDSDLSVTLDVAEYSSDCNLIPQAAAA